jgi:hypothetical protein
MVECNGLPGQIQWTNLPAIGENNAKPIPWFPFSEKKQIEIDRFKSMRCTVHLLPSKSTSTFCL